MKFTRKKTIWLTLICSLLLIPLVYSILSGSSVQAPVSPTPEGLDGPKLAIPESPFGVIGLFITIFAAFGLYVVVKQHKKTP